MTPDEVALLKSAGQVFVQDFSSMGSLFKKGIYFVITSLAMYNLIAKHNKTRATWVLCAMLTLIFIIATAYTCLYVMLDFKLVIGALIENTELEFSERVQIADTSVLPESLGLMWVSSNGTALLFIFGDGIVVWRAWAVWPHRRSVIILPAMTLLGTFEYLYPRFVNGQASALIIASSTMSIATNLIAVILIGIKAYQHRKLMKETIGLGASAAGKVLMFLTESGVVYVVFQVISICLITLDHTQASALDFAANTWTVVMNIFSAAYPSLVILIINYQHSIAHLTVGSSAGEQDLGTHISFARSLPPSHKTMESINSQTDHTAIQESGERDIEKVSEP
ncbi:hypothetical protein C8J56DRAFT_883326 [Mycena floridula]|nr:hypothetical protein C8J56DRAFT_883326 [Mycena floridula]